MARRILAALVIIALALPLSVPVVGAQPLGNQFPSLDPSEVKLWSDPPGAIGDGSSLSFETTSTGTKWAVLIGISNYDGTTNDLWNPDKDAIDMKAALIEEYGFPSGNIMTLLNSEATAQAIVGAIDWLNGVEKAGDTVVFLFSGHGYRVSDRSGWDSDREPDRYDECIVSYDLYAITDGYLRQKFSDFETTRFALIFGSCYSGGMFDSSTDLQAADRVICAACKANQYGWDYLNLGNTLFGYYFIDAGILQGNAEGINVGGDGVSMEEALKYAYPLVTALQRKSQPQIYDGFTGELVP
jgi:uncharacterized caspase-like protein